MYALTYVTFTGVLLYVFGKKNFFLVFSDLLVAVTNRAAALCILF